MNWSKTLPNKPGAYWIRHPEPYTTGRGLVEVVHNNAGVLVVRETLFSLEHYSNREWCGPLVPANEIERAWREGFNWVNYNLPGSEAAWSESRAKKVMEGTGQ